MNIHDAEYMESIANRVKELENLLSVERDKVQTCREANTTLEARVDELQLQYDLRVSVLIKANSEEVSRRRAAEQKLNELQSALRCLARR